MKHLKKYNEDLIFEGAGIKEQEKLLSFCEENLVSLIDNNYSIVVRKPYGKYKKTMLIQIFRLPGNNAEDWDDIKDNFIPFLVVLRNNYNIGLYPKQDVKVSNKKWFDSRVSFAVIGDKINDIMLDDLIKDKCHKLNSIYRISILIHNK